MSEDKEKNVSSSNGDFPDVVENQHCSSSTPNTTSVSPRSGLIIKKIKTNAFSAGPLIPPSPPKEVSIDQLAEAANCFYKMSIAHEITLDDDFKVKPIIPAEDTFHHKVKDTVHRAFWDMQRQKLHADPPDYTSALGLLKEIKKYLTNLIMPHQSNLQAYMDEMLDISIAETQIEKTGKFDLEFYATPVIDLIASWCAPIRDNDVNKLRQISEPIEFFRQVFVILELMNMDMANFTIKKMRPYIRQQAAVYEREKFDKCLEMQTKAGIDGLAITKLWLEEAYTRLLSSFKPDNEPALTVSPDQEPRVNEVLPQTSASIPPTPNNILREAYLMLFKRKNNFEFPETVLVDSKRIIAISDCLSKTVALASLILCVCNTIASNWTTILPSGSMVSLKAAINNDARAILDTSSAEELVDLTELMIAQMLVVVKRWQASIEEKIEDVACLVNKPLPDKCVSETLAEQLKVQITSVLSGDHTVFNLMFSRALDFLRTALSANPPDPMTIPSGFGALSDSIPPSIALTCERLVAGCAMQMPEQVSRNVKTSKTPSTDLSRTYDLSIIASHLLHIITHNRRVFGPHYAEIIQKLLFRTATAS